MNIHHKAVTACLILSLTVAITSSHGKDRAIGQNIHRAYEPASMLLDVNLQQDTLNLFLSISPEAASTITTLPPGALARSLQEFTPLVTLPDDAQCRQTQKQFLVEPEDSPDLKAELLAAQLSEINGYLEYECQHPENLSHFTFLAFEAIPDLKHTSVWLVSDNWQSKQQLSQKQQEVQLQKQPAKSDFLPDFFND
ncbi:MULTISPECIES: DUF2796 domain-containing protein [Gammaproteobacteria]|uniref:ZrgA family zinc uptake protein n=1 Tax=Gammaproteobacteria TaxID=1236 RepID=UPI001ADBEFB7|nr:MULTISPECIES: DUF2796 domain-containing protein [Gammaproteobacteria]MBO9481391.1 DUF2796 domain-containing protein [Salinisphaera sp. G21_0]MBO9493808.1 DUF2796 domain-containing protein [Thalassotalea sp. G20_0]